MCTGREPAKEDVVRTYDGILLGRKKNETTALAATCMDLEVSY